MAGDEHSRRLSVASHGRSERRCSAWRGVAETNLRPSGKGRFGDKLVDVVTEGDLIERGKPITIVEVQGSRVVVKALA